MALLILPLPKTIIFDTNHAGFRLEEAAQMEKKTYYMILGVSRSESPVGIRAAYRQRAKRLHPDVAGEGATRAFQELTEAYDVLSNEQRRREYNERLSRSEQREDGLPPNARTGGSSEHRPTGRVVREPVSVMGNPDGVSPSFDAMLQRFFRNLTGMGVPKSERLEPLRFEVLLTPDEMMHGVLVPVGVPVWRPCPRCSGSGRHGFFPCEDCGGSRYVRTETTVGVEIPPMLAPGSLLEVPLDRLGIHNFYLQLRVFLER